MANLLALLLAITLISCLILINGVIITTFLLKYRKMMVSDGQNHPTTSYVDIRSLKTFQFKILLFSAVITMVCLEAVEIFHLIALTFVYIADQDIMYDVPVAGILDTFFFMIGSVSIGIFYLVQLRTSFKNSMLSINDKITIPIYSVLIIIPVFIMIVGVSLHIFFNIISFDISLLIFGLGILFEWIIVIGSITLLFCYKLLYLITKQAQNELKSVIFDTNCRNNYNHNYNYNHNHNHKSSNNSSQTKNDNRNTTTPTTKNEATTSDCDKTNNENNHSHDHHSKNSTKIGNNSNSNYNHNDNNNPVTSQSPTVQVMVSESFDMHMGIDDIHLTEHQIIFLRTATKQAVLVSIVMFMTLIVFVLIIFVKNHAVQLIINGVGVTVAVICISLSFGFTHDDYTKQCACCDNCCIQFCQCIAKYSIRKVTLAAKSKLEQKATAT